MGAVTADSSCTFLEQYVYRACPSRPDSSERHGPRATASSTRHLCPIFLRTDPKLCRACDATALQERRQERREAAASVRLQRVPTLTVLLQRSFTLHHHHRRVFQFLFLFHPLAWRLLPFRCPGKHTLLAFRPFRLQPHLSRRPLSPSALTAGLRLFKETEKDIFTASWPFNPCLSSS